MNSYGFDAFGHALDFDPQTVDTPWLFGGDGMYDAAIGVYWHGNGIRARQDFRFLQMDTYAGSTNDPISLHKYLYANANPISYSDPSGNESLLNLLTSFSINAILFRVSAGATLGAVDAYLGGSSIWKGAVLGAATFGIAPLIPWEFGLTLAAIGLADAALSQNLPLFVYRTGMLVSGMGLASYANNIPGGGTGGFSTRIQNLRVATDLSFRGWHIRGGGGMVSEEYIPGINGGTKGSTRVDITAYKSINGKPVTLRIQTVDTDSFGIPTGREANAALRIMQAFPNDRLILIPKAPNSYIPDVVGYPTSKEGD